MLRWPSDRAETHEDLFVARYEQLFQRALRLTEQSRERAEDLVHEAFVHFVLGRPDLAAIQNLDAYLFGILRNLHLSQVRRAARGPIAWLSAIDYDSAEIGLRDADVARRLEMQDQLVAILRFACERKRSSKSGGVLLLRFFHGYYPEEIARILGGPVRSVDDWMRLARREARQALESPCNGSTAQQSLQGLPRTTQPDDFVLALRAAVFAAGDGDCDDEALAESLRARPRATLPTALLAHLVSCRACLERTNAILGLSPVSARYPTDSLGPGGRTPPAGGGTSGRVERVAARRLRDVLHHQPKELRIFTNGFLVASQKVAAPETEQSFSVTMAEPIAFVEAFSEQGVRLGLLAVTPPPLGDVSQRATVSFDGDRALELEVHFGGSWPTIRATYRGQSGVVAGSEWSQSGVRPVSAWGQSGVRYLRKLFTPWIALPAGALAVALLIIVAQRRDLRPPAGDVLLARAALVEQAVDAAAPLVHRTLVIDERPAGPSTSLRASARRRLEIWRDTAARRAVRRLFDSTDRLVAAEWSDANGVVVFARDSTPRVRRLDAVAARRVAADEFWRAASASDLSAALGPVRLGVSDVADAYIVAFTPADRAAPAWLAAAQLRIRKSDSHLVEEVLSVRHTGGVVDYHIVEVGFARVDRSRAPADVFAIDPDVERVTSSPGAPPADASAAGTIMTTFAAIRLQLTAVQMLHDAGACLGEQVAVTRTPAGIVRIDGVVDNDGRRRELMTALEPLRGEQALQLRIASASGRAAAWSTRGPSTVRNVDVGSGRMAAHAELSQYFASTGLSAADAEDAVRAFAERSLETSRRILLNAWAVKRLTDEFRPDVLRAMGAEPYARWVRLIADHAGNFRADLDALRRDIAPVVHRELSITSEEPIAAGDLWSASERLLALTTRLDAELRGALAISDGATASALGSDAFWQAVDRALALADALRQAS